MSAAALLTSPLTPTANDLLAEGCVTIDGAKKDYGLGRTRLYELMNNGALPYSKVGDRRLIPRVALKRLIAAGLVGLEAGSK